MLLVRECIDLNQLHSFIKLHLGAASPEPADVETLRMELADLQQKCNLLMGENKELRNRLMQYEPSPEERAAE
ncbi:c-Myc-binding protein [Dissostichus eleginoides]|uniref:c-Myc-binding protein n=1 Tax=Dissostichus eleginoides TaxID=100907 RepID=A0AAD9BFU1_DISEL|nr:c-Myc-binding protein [Dissostichus eleginoides]